MIYDYAFVKKPKLFLVQSKWRKDGIGGITQEEGNVFAEGVRRILNYDLSGCNAKLVAKKQSIDAAIRDMDYQIEIVYCHTGNQSISNYASRPINELLKQVNEDDSTELLIFSEKKLQDIYDYLANGQSSDNIVLDDVLLSNWGTAEAPFRAYYGTLPGISGR